MTVAAGGHRGAASYDWGLSYWSCWQCWNGSVLSFCLNGVGAVTHPASPRGGKRLLFLMGVELNATEVRYTGDGVGCLHVNSVTVTHPQSSQSQYWLSNSLTVCFLCSESGRVSLVREQVESGGEVSPALSSHRTPEWPHFTLLWSQFFEWQIDCCMGGYQKRIHFISCLSCKVKWFFKNLIKMSLSQGLEHVLQLLGEHLSPPGKALSRHGPVQALAWWAGQGRWAQDLLLQPRLPQMSGSEGQLGPSGHLWTSSCA